MNRILILLISIATLTACSCQSRNTAKTHYDHFHPGEVWYDTNSVPVQAHACGIIKAGDT
ncbi:MAG TPA: hypothetical protein VE870_07560 [Bacteroidales bacterium]|nr:hypothetical protein [Bacteroidales bacterium]